MKAARSGSIVRLSLVSALLLCAQSALGQTRPIIPEVFQSPVAIEITTGTGVMRGVGRVVFDQPSGRARVRYALQSGVREELFIRYDLGAFFTSDPPACDVTPVTGTMPLSWEWISQAKQGEGAIIDGLQVTFWVSTSTPPSNVSAFGFGEGIQRVATTLEDHTTPVVYELITPERTVRLRFLHFRKIFRAKPNLFKLPRNCVR